MSLQLLGYDLHVHQELVQSPEAGKIKGKIVIIMFSDAIPHLHFHKISFKLIDKEEILVNLNPSFIRDQCPAFHIGQSFRGNLKEGCQT